jgi:hypothetical protein
MGGWSSGLAQASALERAESPDVLVLRNCPDAIPSPGTSSRRSGLGVQREVHGT